MARFTQGENISPKTHLLCFDVDGTLRPSGQPFSSEMIDVLREKISQGYALHFASSRRMEELEGNVPEDILASIVYHGAYGHELVVKGACLKQPEAVVLPSFVFDMLRKETMDNMPSALKCGAHIAPADAGHLAYTFVGVEASQTQRNNFEIFDVAEGFRERVKEKILRCAKSEGVTLYVEAFGRTSIDVSDKPFCKTEVLKNLSTLGEKRDIVFFGDGMDGGNDEALARYLLLENVSSLAEHYTKNARITRHVTVPVETPEETLEILRLL